MNISVMSVLSWDIVKTGDKFLVSTFMEELYGTRAGTIVTALILCIAMSSLFAVVLGYSRVPYAAAVDGNFFRIFAKLHPTKDFPYISLLALCAMGLLFSMFMKLSDVIAAILAMRIIIQFIAQSVGVLLLRRREGNKGLPFKMWLYPIPVFLSIAIWIYLLSYNKFALHGIAIALLGVVIYFMVNRKRKD